MSNEIISIEELTKKRTPLELLSWVKQKMEQIESTDEGEGVLRLHEGLAKQLMEEVYPLAIFGRRKFGNTQQVLLQPIIGNQSYDALVTDLRNKPPSLSYVEITQAHEGESDYLRRLVLQQQGIAFGPSPPIKKGTKKKGLQVSTPVKAVNFSIVARDEQQRIIDAAKRKAGKDYPTNTSLVIMFNDDFPFRQHVNDSNLATFVKEHILNLDLRFSTLYLIGWREEVFLEFSLGKRT